MLCYRFNATQHFGDMESVFYDLNNKNMKKEKLNEIDAILHELQMDEYLNEHSLPKIEKVRELVQNLVKNCSISRVSCAQRNS